MAMKAILLILVVIAAITPASSGIITVGQENSNYTYIQNAINNASDGDTILVHKGNYSENLTVDKPLSLESIYSNPEDVIISSKNSSLPVIHVTSDNVKISGLTILGKQKDNIVAGIFLDNVNSVLIQNNIISNTSDGLLIDASSRIIIQNNAFYSNSMHGACISNSANNELTDNLIANNEYGLYLDLSDENTLVNNNASNNEKYGIALRKSNNNIIAGNHFFSNKYGLTITDSNDNEVIDNVAGSNNQSGFLLWKGNSNTIKGNILDNNENSGIYFLSLCSNNTLNGNILSGNLNGISIESANDNFIVNNTFSSNEKYGVYYAFTGNENTFKDNTYENNREKNIKFSFIQTIILRLFIVLLITAFALYFNISWLKKLLLIGAILTLIIFILIIAWYFPFEAGMTENVEIINMQWTDSKVINTTHTRGNLSLDLVYKDKYAHPDGFGDTLSADIHISSRNIPGGEYELWHQEPVILKYMEEYHYSQNLDLERKDQDILVQLYTEVFYDYPNPVYGDSKIEELGMNVLQINQSVSDGSQGL